MAVLARLLLVVPLTREGLFLFEIFPCETEERR